MQDLLPYITGGTGAVAVLAIVCWLFFTGKLHSDDEFTKLEKENSDLKSALADERKAVDDAARTGTVTNQLIAALIKVATQKQGRDRDDSGDPLKPENLGL